jgi:hypothetical protein
MQDIQIIRCTKMGNATRIKLTYNAVNSWRYVLPQNQYPAACFLNVNPDRLVIYIEKNRDAVGRLVYEDVGYL